MCSLARLDLPEVSRAALRRTPCAMPPASEGPGGVAKAPYLRPILVMNLELGVCRAPSPSSRLWQLSKPGTPEFSLQPGLVAAARGRQAGRGRG